MISTISQYDFVDAFKRLRPNNFSYEGLLALFDWFEMLEEDCDQKIELDVIAICCDYAEFENIDEIIDQYADKDDNGSITYCQFSTLDELENFTEVIRIPDSDGFIVNCNF